MVFVNHALYNLLSKSNLHSLSIHGQHNNDKNKWKMIPLKKSSRKP